MKLYIAIGIALVVSFILAILISKIGDHFYGEV
jgi:hypothetical protein